MENLVEQMKQIDEEMPNVMMDVLMEQRWDKWSIWFINNVTI